MRKQGIKYKHQEGNITPALDISDMSISKSENERLIFPFTFFRINKFETNPKDKNSYIFYMDIINRKKIIEYDLKEGIKYNVEDLEESYEESDRNNEVNLEEGKQSTFKVQEATEEKKSLCNIF